MGSKPIGISASRGAAILGQCKYSEPVEAWLKICEAITPGFCEANMYPTPEFVDNPAVKWGLALEQHIMEFAEPEHGCNIEDPEKFYAHPEHDFITCHIDGQYTDGVLHEGKTVNQRTYHNEWGEPGTDRIPTNYMIQVQHQMMLTGAKECIVSALVLPKMQTDLPDIEEIKPIEIAVISDALKTMGYFHQYPVKRNEKLIDLMLKTYIKFWNENVLKKIPPKPESLEWVKKLIPKPCGTILADEQVQRWSTERSGITQEMKAAKNRKDELSGLILDYMREQADLDDVCIDKESTEKLILLASNGFKLHSYNGKTFR